MALCLLVVAGPLKEAHDFAIGLMLIQLDFWVTRLHWVLHLDAEMFMSHLAHVLTVLTDRPKGPYQYREQR